MFLVSAVYLLTARTKKKLIFLSVVETRKLSISAPSKQVMLVMLRQMTKAYKNGPVISRNDDLNSLDYLYISGLHEKLGF